MSALSDAWSSGQAAAVPRSEAYARVLLDGIQASIPMWVVDVADRVFEAQTGRTNLLVALNARAAGERCWSSLADPLHALLLDTPPEYMPVPLALLTRLAVPYPNDVLRRLGVPPPDDDETLALLAADNEYDIHLRDFRELSPRLERPAALWSYARATEFLDAHGGKMPADAQDFRQRGWPVNDPLDDDE